MRFFNFLSFFLLVFVGCSTANQLPQLQIVYPTENNLYQGSKYKNQQSLLNDQVEPGEPVIYFNYEDFRDFDPSGRIIIEKPFDTIKDLKNIPPQAEVGLYHELTIDSSAVEFLSNLLLKANRPVLNNFYTGKEIYRFVWTRAWHDDYIFELDKSDNQANIHTTKIDQQTGMLEKSEKVITLKQFEEFEQILTKGNFWAIKPYQWVLQIDGSNWTIEAHVPLGYKVLSRSSPGLIQADQHLLRQAGQWMISQGTDNVKKVY